jgi:hypothetical protein
MHTTIFLFISPNVHILPIRPQQRSLLLIPLNPIGINPRGNNKNNTKSHIPIQTIHKRIIP